MWVHPRDTNRCPPKQEANGWPAGPVRLWSGLRTQELHTTTYLKRIVNPEAFCLVLFSLQAIPWFLFFFRWNVYKFWVCGSYIGHCRWWRIFQLHKIPKCCYSHYCTSVGRWYVSHSIPPRQQKTVLQAFFLPFFVHWHASLFLKDIVRILMTRQKNQPIRV